DPKYGWVGDVLKFWFEETDPDQWFKKDPTLDASIRQRFLRLHEILVCRGNNGLLADARTALAAVNVLDVAQYVPRHASRIWRRSTGALGGGDRHRPRI